MGSLPPAAFTNPRERLSTEIKRRTAVVGIFRNEAAITRLAGVVLLEVHDEWQVAGCYLSEGSMPRLALTGDDGPRGRWIAKGQPCWRVPLGQPPADPGPPLSGQQPALGVHRARHGPR